VPGEKVDILIVDDRDDGLIALETVLNMPNINLIKAHSGREALAHLAQHDVGLILMDVQMPEMDGFQCALQVRNNPRHRLTPIIFVTAINKDDRYVYRGYEAGAVDYLFKPFDPQILRAKVSIFLELFRKARQLKAQADLIRESEMRERYLRLAELEVESLKRYRNLADAIPHLVWRARADGSMDYFNKGWADYTGLSLEQSGGTGWQRAFHAEDLAKFLKCWMHSMEDGKAFDMECRIHDNDNNWRWHWVQAVCERTASGTVVAWIGTCTDIHERKIGGEKLIAAERKAKAANMSKTTFLANMSHEIRTPMNSILGFTELMRNPAQSEAERMECVETVQRNGQSLLKIIDEILDISKVEAGQLQMETLPVDLGQLVRDVRGMLQLQAEEKGLALEFSLVRSMPGSVYTDPTRLRQILVNLIANAIKFTSRGGVTVEIDWLAESRQNVGKLQFRIRDTGIGIDQGKAELLFQPFMQVDSSTTRHYGGSGLGLALSREFARALGGDAVLESSHIGVGSCFLVEIVAKPVAATGVLEKLDFRPKQDTQAWNGQKSKPLAGVNVLLVDDLIDNRELLSQVLSMAGAQVDLADNGREGVKKAMEGEHNLVLMDIQMPLMDGYEATKQLRANGFGKPIIALTAYALREERERCLEAGCDDHLTKPIKMKSLIEQVSKLATRPAAERTAP